MAEFMRQGRHQRHRIIQLRAPERHDHPVALIVRMYVESGTAVVAAFPVSHLYFQLSVSSGKISSSIWLRSTFM